MEAIELSDGICVQLIPKYTPTIRKDLQRLITTATSKDVDAAYEAVQIFISKIYVVENEQERELSMDSLMDCSYDDYIKVVDGILELVKYDASMYKAIGVSFGRVQLTEEDLQKVQKKMTE